MKKQTKTQKSVCSKVILNVETGVVCVGILKICEICGIEMVALVFDNMQSDGHKV